MAARVTVRWVPVNSNKGVTQMKKKTQELIHEIMESRNLPEISRYLVSNQEEFLDIPLHVYLKERLAQDGFTVSQVVQASNKGEYIYQVFRGIKKPSRDVALSIALAMKLGPQETERMLRIAHLPQLDARNRRDSIILFALNRQLTVPDTNDILYELGEACFE